MQSNIRKTYNSVFRGKKIGEYRVSAYTARLVANCILAYNSLILNLVHEKMLDNDAPQEVINEFIRISPIGWTHTLLTGLYNFMKSDGKIDVEAMVQILEDHVRQHFWKDEWPRLVKFGGSYARPLAPCQRRSSRRY